MRFSTVSRGLISCVAMVQLCACALLIPENPSEPRYNKVMGERHMPELNPRSALGPQSRAQAPAAMGAPAPMAEPEMAQVPVEAAPAPAPVMAMDLPPVSPQTQQIAAQRIEAARSVPEENIQLASGDFPLLNDVPKTAPRTGDAAAAAQLEKVRAQLEAERNAASTTTRQVKEEAAAEPSMLSDLPPTSPVAPAPAAIPSKPIAPPTPASPPREVPATSMLERSPVPTRMADLPPPPAPMTASNSPIAMDALPMGQAPMPMAMAAAPAPMGGDGLPPIQLKSPTAQGHFDPMQGTEKVKLTSPNTRMASNQFLPSSRYSYRR